MLDEILLYENSDSPFCLKTRICLNLKGVPFRRVPITLGRARDLRRLNPLRKVPVLVLGTEVLTDSSRIARHLDASYPEPALLPTDAAARAYALLLEEWADEALYFIVGAFKWLNPANRAAALDNTVTEMTGRALRPLVGWGLARSVRRRYAAWGYTAAALGEFEERMRDNLDVLATLLADKPYLLGRRPTLADVAVFAQLNWMRRYIERRLLAGRPELQDWLARVEAVPAIAAALVS